MPQCPADRAKRYAGIAACGLGYDVAGFDLSLLVCPYQNVQGHSIFYASGQIMIFGFGVNDTPFPLKSIVNNQ